MVSHILPESHVQTACLIKTDILFPSEVTAHCHKLKEFFCNNFKGWVHDNASCRGLANFPAAPNSATHSQPLHDTRFVFSLLEGTSYEFFSRCGDRGYKLASPLSFVHKTSPTLIFLKSDAFKLTKRSKKC
jgi:hypothetical protein